jgi:hypothetical protein
MLKIQDKTYQKKIEQGKKNWMWFEKNREKLLEKYSEEFVAISEEKVIAHHADLDKLLENIPLEYKDKQRLVEYLSKEGIELIL